MKKIFLLAILLVGAVTEGFAATMTFTSAGNGYMSFAEYSMLQPDGTDFDHLVYRLMKDGAVIPGITSVCDIRVDELDNAVYAEGDAYEQLRGLRNVATGEVIIKPAYTSIIYVGEGRYMLYRGGPDSFVIWNLRTGVKSAPVKGYVYDSLRDGLLLFNGDGGYGYVDADNNVKVEPRYDFSCGYSEGLASVRSGGKWGFIDKAGKMVIPMQYDDDETWYDSDEPDIRFLKSRACVMKNGKYGVIDKAGNVVVPFKYDYVTIDTLKNQITGARYDDTTTYDIMDIDGRRLEVIAQAPCRVLFDDLYLKSSGDEWSSLNGVVDVAGKEIIPMKYNYITHDGGLIICQIYSYDNPATPVMDIYDRTGKLLYHGVDCMYMPFFVG